ncbi:MAG: hypothetical protein NTW16_05600, partial [Bacteroidetes bacterium]|nr:hypothetical protein [Bacteroidota bacterium]
MKNLILFVISLMLIAGNAIADVTKTVGGTGADYATLKAAFDAINAGTIKTGAIILQITGSTTESASAVLNASGTGSASYTSVLIYPTAGSLSISTTGNWATIYLNGADHVTIDGRVGAAGTLKSLTITGTNTGNGATAIRLINSAENNTVKYCNLSGSSASSASGIVAFAGSISGNGNDNNILEDCNLTSSAGGRPYNAILSSGTGGRENSDNTIRNNNISDNFQTNVSSNGININSASVGFTISGNSIYETTTFYATGNALTYNAIIISTAAEHTVSGNYIGGSAPFCAGSPWSFTGSNAVYFCGIYVSAGTGTATTISNNTIANIDYSSKDDNPWDGIFLFKGNFNVTGNTIGAISGTGSIVSRTPVPLATTTLSSGGISTTIVVNYGGSGYTTAPVITFTAPPAGGTAPTATANLTGGLVSSITVNTAGSGYTTAPFVIFDAQNNNYSTSHGIINNSTGTVNFTGNNIGSITTVSSDYYAHGFESIYMRGIGATTTFTGNLIGSLTTPNSIHVSSSAVYSLIKQDVYGIYCAGGATATTTISGNTVANLFNSYTGPSTAARTRGIQTTSGTNTIQNNTVRNISATTAHANTASAASIIGISQTSTDGTTQTVTGNIVRLLSNKSTAAANVQLYGIYYTGPASGTNSVSGNFVDSLSVSSASTGAVINGIVINSGLITCANNIVSLGAGVTTGYLINGIWDGTSAGNNVSFYFNTVYLAGTVSSGTTSATAGLWDANNTSTRNYRNNIFCNARTGGSTGIHYALRVAGTTGLTIGYNDYVGALYGITLNTAPDNNSLATNPGFANPGGSSAINYYPSATLNGTSGTGISTDYYGIDRTIPKMGALEANGNVWQGNISDNYGTAGNWTNGIPSDGADIIFATSPAHDCVLDANRTVGNITNGSSKNLVVSGKTLTINKTLSFTSGGKINASTTSSVVKFAGSTAQIIPSAAFTGNSVEALTVDNSAGLTMSGNLTITQALALTSGTFSTGANTLTISGSSITRTTGSMDAGNSASTLVFTNTAAITLPASVFTGALNNLTLSGPGGVKAGGDITVNGVLNLAAGNPSATYGLLEMTKSYTSYPGTSKSIYLDSWLLNMGAAATTIGSGDVTGTVKRATILENTLYTFGHQYTTILLTTGAMPDALSVTITIGNTPPGDGGDDVLIRDAYKRTYEIVPEVSDAYTSPAQVSANFHYLDDELTSSLDPFHENTEAKTVTWDYDIDGGIPADEHGRANYDFTNNYIGLANVPVSYFINKTGHAWRTIFTLRDYYADHYTWNGAVDDVWGTAINWTPNGTPGIGSHVIIPDAGTTPHDPVLPSTTTINSLTIENGGMLIMGNNTLTIQNSFSGGWEDQNPIGNDPGTSKVIFSMHGTTISGNARFYDVEIPDGADITNQAGSTMTILHSITRTGTGTGKWYADVYGATIEYSGADQTVLLTDGSPNFHHLILGGSGTKTMPSSALSIHGNLTVSGTAIVIAGAAITTAGNFTIGPGAGFTAGTFNHSQGGFIIYSDATGTGSLIAGSSFTGTAERYISHNLAWHFLSSPVASQPIWPEFAPIPSEDPLTFGASPWNWDFYYWNPNTDITSELFWVNLRQDNAGTYNSRPVDESGSSAGFGAADPDFTVGRGYLVAYASDYAFSSTHQFTGNMNYSTQTIPLTKGSNSWNLVGNPFPS